MSYTIAQMKTINESHGQHWFEKGSMAFFQTVIQDTATGKYNLFMTSEVDPSGKKAFTLRIFVPHSGRVETVGPFHAMTKAECSAFRRQVVKALDSMGNREKVVFDTLTYVYESDLGPGCIEFTDGENSFTIRDGIIVN